MSRAIFAALSLVLPCATAFSQDAMPLRLLHGPMKLAEVRPDNSVVSPNWSGYAVSGTDGAVNSVSGSWVVPVATCSGSGSRNSGASHWVGIDGYTSATVEQTGTDSDCSSGSPKYYAWYELYPRPGTTISTLSVEAGDVMSASVTYTGSQFALTITDQRTQLSFSISATVPGARRNSAEWIAEDNSAVFTDFGTAVFGEDQTRVEGTCFASVGSTTSSAIGAYPALQVHEIVMSDSAGNTLSQPSPLSADGTSFSVEWLSSL